MKGDAFPENAEARQILCRHGIDPFSARENLSFSPNWCHSGDYAKDVLKRLKKADRLGKSEVIAVLKTLAENHRDCEYNGSGEVDEHTDELSVDS